MGITGAVETSQPSVQQINDKKFERRFVGTFNMQGYIFVESLKKAEEGLLLLICSVTIMLAFTPKTLGLTLIKLK